MRHDVMALQSRAPTAHTYHYARTDPAPNNNSNKILQQYLEAGPSARKEGGKEGRREGPSDPVTMIQAKAATYT